MQETRSISDKVQEVVAALGAIQESSTWKQFFADLSDNSNQDLADKIRGDIASIAMAEQIQEGSE